MSLDGGSVAVLALVKIYIGRRGLRVDQVGGGQRI